MVADSWEEPIDIPPAGMAGEPKKRTRRTKEQIAKDAGGAPKESRAQRWSRLADIHAWVEGLHQGVMAFAPPLRPDALSDAEVTLLAERFDAWQASDAKVHKWTEKALSASPGVALLVVSIGLLLPRLERHGMIPWLPKPVPVEPLVQTEPQNHPNGAHEYTPFTAGMPVGAP